MKCPRCQAENPANAQYCQGCGAVFVAVPSGPAQAAPSTPPRRSNTGAIVAIVIGVVLFGCLFFTAILAAITFPVFAKAREKARESQCMSNVRQSTVAMLMYAQDHNMQLPSSDTVWTDVKFQPNMLTCPTYGIHKGNGYGYNASLSKKSQIDIPNPTVIPLLADSKAPGNLLNTPADIDFRHEGKAMVGYADGHVAEQAPTDIGNLPMK